jgi:nitroreductase
LTKYLFRHYRRREQVTQGARMTMDVDELLTTTRSARKALDLDAPLEPSAIRECLAIATQAANGSNQQSWRWLVIP